MTAGFLSEKRDQLLLRIRSFRSCAVAFSGGVDSAVVAKAAHLALGDRAVAVTATSPSLAEGELALAVEVARQIGIRHRTIHTGELQNPAYTRNAPDRCYHCKTELYSQLEALAAEFDVEVILNGANLDDAGDYRPGMQAAKEHRVCSPLLECGFTKEDVRLLAAEWELPVWNKPASPCLSSRVAYGEEVTPQRLQMIDRAEQFLRELGFSTLRVRYHQADLARIEVPPEALSRMVESPATREKLVQRFQELGFKFVTLDLVGFRSGSLNTLLSFSQLVTLGAAGSGSGE
jgi:uncharacterized protein